MPCISEEDARPSRAIAIQAPWVNFVTSTIDQHEAGHDAAEGVDRPRAAHPARASAGSVSVAQQPVPVPDHAGLAERERDEHADDVELDQPGDLRRRTRRSAGRRTAGQQHDAVAEGQPVAAGVQLARQVAVLGEDRAEHREAVERGVRGQDQDQRGADGDEVERRNGDVAEDRLRRPGRSRCPGCSVADRRCRRAAAACAGSSAICTLRSCAEDDDAAEHRDGDACRAAASVVAAFLTLRLAEGRTPLLIASTPVSAAQPEEKARSSRKTSARPASPLAYGSRADRRSCALSAPAGRRRRSRTKPQAIMPEDRRP